MPHRIKPKIIAYLLCHIALNQTLSHKIEKWCKFSSRTTRNHLKRDLPVMGSAELVDLKTERSNI